MNQTPSTSNNLANNKQGAKIVCFCFVMLSSHTSYLSFVLHGQDLLVIFCSTQKRINSDKMDSASKQRKLQQNGTHCKFGAVCHWSTRQNYSTWQVVLSCGAWMIVMWSNFVPDDLWKISCGAKLLHMNIFAPRTMSAVSATNMMYDLNTQLLTPYLRWRWVRTF